MKKLLKIIFSTLVLLQVGCAVTDSGYVESDKIKLSFGEAGNIKPIVAEDYENFPIYIHFDIDRISFVEITDVSTDDLRCTDDILPSPSTISSYTLNSESSIKDIAFRIRLPCASYHNKFIIEVKVHSSTGKYYVRQKLPVVITHEGPGYFPDGYEYSGALPKK